MVEGYAPEWLAFEQELGYRPKLEGDLPTIFAQWEKLLGDLVSKFTFSAPDTTLISREDRRIGTNGNQVRIYKPAIMKQQLLPLCVYIHGGGWTMGDLDGEDGQCEEFCKRSQVIVVSLGYRLAPQNTASQIWDDCVDGYEWAVENARLLGADPEKVVLSGSSAGGNLAIATALKLIDKKSPIQPNALFTAVPVTVDPRAVPENLKARYTSYQENSDTGPNTPVGMRTFIDAFGPEPHNPYLSPLLHKRLNKLPKTFVTISGKDTLRDDCKLFVEALQNASVPVRFKEYPGFPHYFWTFPSIHLKDVAERYQNDSAEGLKWLLSQDDT